MPKGIAWEILKYYADHFLFCPDYAAAQGMRLLASPAGQDPSVVSGESGASTFTPTCFCINSKRPSVCRKETEGRKKALIWSDFCWYPCRI